MTLKDAGRAKATKRTRAEAERSFGRAREHIAAGRFAEAEVCLRQAVRSDPGLVEAQANLGWVLERRGRVAEAEAAFRLATASDPPHAQAHSLFGTFLAGLRRFDEAQAVYHRGLGADPFSARLWSNLGVLFLQTGRLDEAERCLRTALKIEPESVEASINQAYLCLRRGQYEEGLALYERRGWKNQFQARIGSPRWSGESLEGRSILVVYEGGYGDMIQFCRYVPLLKRRLGATVSVLVPAPLKSLFESLLDVDALLTPDAPLESMTWDCWTSMMSLPYHFGTRLDGIAADIPYLRVPPSAGANARHGAAEAEATVDRNPAAVPAPFPTRLRVGLAWRGNPGFMNDVERSLPSIDALLPLSEIEGVTFVSLQRDDPRPGRVPLGPRFCTTDASSATNATTDFADFADFADLARTIDTLDLVIGVDTAVVHLAAALGKPTWVLLSARLPDWRWLDDRADSPWYPRVMRLFRQTAAGDWRAVIDEVARQLAGLVRNRASVQVE